MLDPVPDTSLDRLMAERPQMLGALVWPYQCANWESGERLRRIIGHCDAIDSLPEVLRFSIDERLVIAGLESVHPGMKLVLDQPEWFLREGGLTLNLYLGSFRAYSIAFSFLRESDGTLTAIIGSIQGRNRTDVLATYREITHQLHGLRPSDFLIEALRVLCRILGVRSILAVSEAARHHRHPYFGSIIPLSHDYDAIWKDRGGVPQNADFFILPVAPTRRDLANVKPNKRPMYRRRFDFLDALETTISADFPNLPPVRFIDG